MKRKHQTITRNLVLKNGTKYLLFVMPKKLCVFCCSLCLAKPSSSGEYSYYCGQVAGFLISQYFSWCGSNCDSDTLRCIISWIGGIRFKQNCKWYSVHNVKPPRLVNNFLVFVWQIRVYHMTQVWDKLWFIEATFEFSKMWAVETCPFNLK